MLEKITEIVKPIVESLGYELVDIEIKKRGRTDLIVYIYNKDGTCIDDCEKVHLAIEQPLDELDPFVESWYLNVSSPGVDRAFKTQADFVRNIDKLCEIKLYKPYRKTKHKQLTATLLEYNADTKVVTVKLSGVQLQKGVVSLAGEIVKFNLNEIAKISQAIAL
ncbi:MAG: ribosome maturation factor RimP [Firmicutes bacterium]|nr:ribosome maturation factor RimP [Bacillota bacterium]